MAKVSLYSHLPVKKTARKNPKLKMTQKELETKQRYYQLKRLRQMGKISGGEFKNVVTVSVEGKPIAHFFSRQSAIEYGQALADKTKKQVSVE